MLNRDLFSMVSMKTLAERITHVLNTYKGEQAGLARKVGVSKSTITQWKDGSTKNIRPIHLFTLARETGFAAEWIGTGAGPMMAGSDNDESLQKLNNLYATLPPEGKAELLRVAEKEARYSASQRILEEAETTTGGGKNEISR